MKKNVFILIIMLSFFAIFSNISAYQSPEGQLPQFSPENPENSSIKNGISIKSDAGSALRNNSDSSFPEPNQNYQTNTSLTINSLQLLGEYDANTSAALQFMEGLKFGFSSQSGETPMQSFEMSRNGTSLFAYTGQLTNPYYVTCSLLGTDTYMICPEDQFEEKLTASVYKILEQMTDGNSNLPDIDSVYTMIRAFRESNETGAAFSGNTQLSFDREIDASAFELPLISLLMKFEETVPPSNNTYRYIDIPAYKRTFDWPEIISLPALPTPVSSSTGTLNSEDLLSLINALQNFFSDNPELAAMMNLQIHAGLERSNPELAGMDNVDYLSDIIKGLKETAETDLRDTVFKITIGSGENGEIQRVSIETEDTGKAVPSGSVIIFQKSGNETRTVSEISLDTVNNGVNTPVFRALLLHDAEEDGSGKDTLNMLLDENKDTRLEYTHTADQYIASTMTKVSDIDFKFDWNGERGTGKLFTTEKPNQYGTGDTSMLLNYEHSSQGKPLFTAEISGETKMSEPAPGLDPDTAVPVSRLSESDYDTLASQIFLQIMMMTMNLVQN